MASTATATDAVAAPRAHPPAFTALSERVQTAISSFLSPRSQASLEVATTSTTTTTVGEQQQQRPPLLSRLSEKEERLLVAMGGI